MNYLKRIYKVIIFGALFLLSGLLFFVDFHKSTIDEKNGNELFRPELTCLNSLEKIITYNDSIYLTKKIKTFDTAAYVKIVSETIKQRFYFGLLHYRFAENWIAALSGKLLWSHLSAVVNPNDILKHSEGLCSQQTIVFMELLKRKKINSRSLGLGKITGPGHFICEVHYNNAWRLYDVTKEPEWDKIVNHHQSMEYYLANKDSLFAVYKYRMSRNEFDEIIQKVSYGKANESPAKKMLLFHKITLIFSYFLPIFFLIMFIWNYKKYKDRL